MSSEVSQNSYGSAVSGAFTSSAIMTGGFGGLSAIKRNRGVKKAIKQTKENNKIVKEAFGEMTLSDRFVKNPTMGKTYSEYVDAQKRVAKLYKIKDSKLPSWLQKILHPFTNVKNIDGEIIKAEKARKVVDDNLKNLSKLEITPKDFAKNMGKTFKSEFKDPFGLFFAGSEMVSRFTTQALPAFKNEGFIAGLKETGKAIAAGGATLITDAGLSVVFRTLGATIGGFLGPLGASIGSIVGNAVGGMMSSTLVQKIFPAKVQSTELTQENIQQEVTAQVEQPQVITTKSGATMPLDKSLTPQQVEQLAYAQAFQGKVPQVKYYA